MNRKRKSVNIKCHMKWKEMSVNRTKKEKSLESYEKKHSIDEIIICHNVICESIICKSITRCVTFT